MEGDTQCMTQPQDYDEDEDAGSSDETTASGGSLEPPWARLIALPPHSHSIAAAGRDGRLRVWDLRLAQPLVGQASSATGAWTMGVRAQDRRAATPGA